MDRMKDGRWDGYDQVNKLQSNDCSPNGRWKEGGMWSRDAVHVM